MQKTVPQNPNKTQKSLCVFFLRTLNVPSHPLPLQVIIMGKLPLTLWEKKGSPALCDQSWKFEFIKAPINLRFSVLILFYKGKQRSEVQAGMALVGETQEFTLILKLK